MVVPTTPQEHWTASLPSPPAGRRIAVSTTASTERTIVSTLVAIAIQTPAVA